MRLKIDLSVRLLAVATLVLVAGILLAVDRFWLSLAWGFASGAPLPVILFVAFLALVGAAYFLPSRAAGVGAVVVMVGFFAALALTGWFSGRAYMSSVSVVDSPMPSHEVRAPYEVAQALSRQAITTPGDVNDADTTYIPDTASYTSLVRSRVFLGSWTEIISQRLDATGLPTTHNCTFSPRADKALHGVLSHDLQREIARMRFGVLIDANDAYGFCDGDVPKVVVPLTRNKGFYPTTRVPAGVAVYDGHANKVTILDSVEPGVLPGPVYPLSLVERQRQATAASGSFGDWVFGRAGYQPTSTNDAADPNAGNAGEFTLRSSDGRSNYVTPVVLRGTSTSISAVATTGADTVAAGQLSPLVFHRLVPARNSNSNVASDIKGTYPELSWATPGFGIFEIVPTNSGEWIATVGLNQKVTHRVSIATDGGTCLHTADGAKVRCTSDKPVTGSVSIPTELSSLSDAELAKLGKAVADEWQRRHG